MFPNTPEDNFPSKSAEVLIAAVFVVDFFWCCSLRMACFTCILSSTDCLSGIHSNSFRMESNLGLYLILDEEINGPHLTMDPPLSQLFTSVDFICLKALYRKILLK